MEPLTLLGIVGIILVVFVVTGTIKLNQTVNDLMAIESGREYGWMKVNPWTLIQTPSGYGRFSGARRNNSGTYDILLETDDGDAWLRDVDPLKDLLPLTGEMIFTYLAGQGVYPIPITMDQGGGSTKVSMSQFLGLPDINVALADENERLRQRYTNSQNFSTNPHDGVQSWNTLKNEAQQLANINRSLASTTRDREEVRVQRPMNLDFNPEEDGGNSNE